MATDKVLKDIATRRVPRAKKIAATSAEPAPVPAPASEIEPTTPKAETKKAKAATKGAGKRATPRKGASSIEGTRNIAFYMPPSLVDDLRRAYTSDRDQLDDAPTSMARWVARALEIHARKNTAHRRGAALEATTYDDGPNAGSARPFRLPEASITAMDHARAADLMEGVSTSRTAFAVAAIRVEVDAARHRAGGVLPEVPEKLPTRQKADA